MKPSKHIERLFQEGLNDLYASPPDDTWDKIEKRLTNKNNKRRIIPLWWREAASIAAILAIFSTIGVFYFYTYSNKSSSVVDKQILESKPNSKVFEISPVQFRFSFVDSKLSSIETSFNNKLAFQITKFKPTSVPKIKEDNFTSEKNSIPSVNRLAYEGSLLNSGLPIKFSVISVGNSTAIDQPQKKSLFDEIEPEGINAESSTSVVSQWEIKPTVAPVFMNSTNGGNPLESTLRGKTTANPNVSFGLNVAYAINKKIKIRTGINQVAMGYNTQDVVLSTTSSSFSSSASSSNLKSSLIGSVQFMNVPAIENQSLSSTINSGFIESQNFSSVGVLNHELGFLEVPLELEYAIINKKIGLHVLGGASTYFLNNNEIFFEENGNSSRIGEAQNLNSLSFSANLGFGMNYNFSKALSFNLEPKFLYQINTFQANNSDFQPYFFGIYSGLKIKF